MARFDPQISALSRYTPKLSDNADITCSLENCPQIKQDTFWTLRIQPDIAARLIQDPAMGHGPEQGMYGTFRPVVRNFYLGCGYLQTV